MTACVDVDDHPELGQQAAAVGPAPGTRPKPLFAPDILWENGYQTINHSYIPPGRTTHDGRIEIESFSAGGFMPRCFRLLRPEAMTGHISTTLQSIAGALTDRRCVDAGVLHSSAYPLAVGIQSVICDAGADQPAGPVTTFSTNKQPTPCGPNLDRDCYHVSTIVHVDTPAGAEEIWSKKFRIEVANPKTAAASIAAVVADPEPPQVGYQAGVTEILEPVISGDGRVLVYHEFMDIKYSHNPDGDAYGPCDARGFGPPKPISQMHGDPAMSAYGLAKFPLRDSENNPVPAGNTVGGAYPWIDRDVNNLFITTGGAPLWYRHPTLGLQPRYPVVGSPEPSKLSPEPPTSNADIEKVSGSANNGGRTGVTVMGLWTQGKMVVLDNRINNSDIAVLENCVSQADHSTDCALPPIHDRLLRLYHDAAGNPVDTRIGASNNFFINSPEHLFNYDPDMRPVTPRDVVWQVAATTGTDEVAFDDYMATRALVFSPMNAPVANTHTDLYRRNFLDGFSYRPEVFGGDGWTQDPHVQNAVGSTFWNVPKYGLLQGGGRIEPIAAGGVRGKGIFLDGNDTITYTVPAQTSARTSDMAASAWTYGIWFNPTTNLTATPARLLRTPDGTDVSLSRNATGVGTLTLKRGTAAAVTFTLPAALTPSTTRYTHLALVQTPAGSSTTVHVHVDGYLLESRLVNQQLLRTSAGSIVVGGGATGWVDELKVLARAPNPEELCNHAYGTLVGVTSGPGYTAAGNYPTSSHTAITTAIGAGTTYSRYYCESQVFTGADTGGFVCRTSRTSARCVGRRAIFPEGPLLHGVPRPVSTANTFCTSCHDDSNPSPTMKLAALEKRTTAHEDDVRRQPMQPEPLLWGVIPAGFFAPGVPASSITSNPDGYEVDKATLPAGTALCNANLTTLCLMNRRFSVTLNFTDPNTGASTAAKAVPHTPNTGHFWFFSANNLEVTTKVLDGHTINSKAWVFQSGITSIPYVVTVTDHFNNNAVKTYTTNAPAGDIVCGTQDTAAFDFNASMRAIEPVTVSSPLGAPPAGGNCVPGPTRLCVLNRRYEVTARYRNSGGVMTPALVRGEQTNETGFFTFFDANNLELIAKVLDGTAINGKIWLLYGSLTGVVFDITIRDTVVSRQATFTSTTGPQGQQCGRLVTSAL